MNVEEHFAGENLRYLDQGMELIRRLADELYVGADEKPPFRGGVGAQFRHCIDFYGCFLRDLADRRIDYGSRDRKRDVESSRERAIAAIQEVRRALLELTADQAEVDLQIRSEDSPATAESPVWSRSSVGRELQFLVSHTVHHYALIAALLQARGYDIHSELPEFGVAPSTVLHWKESGLTV